MENPRRRKHNPLNVLSPLENGPTPKRTRISPPLPNNRVRIGRRSERTQPQPSSTRRAGKRRREILDSDPEPVNDENQFSELEESLKRLRIRRPFVFSITSFIEQSVDSVSYNLTDGEPELVSSS